MMILGPEQFIKLSADRQDGSLCVIRDKKRKPDGCFFVSVLGYELPDERYLGSYTCEQCGAEVFFAYSAENDPHNPVFCKKCFPIVNEDCLFFVGTQTEINLLWNVVKEFLV